MDDISAIRQKIDKVDAEILTLLQEREGLVVEIGSKKNRKNLPIEDQKREEEILKKAPSSFTSEIYKKILNESKKLQR